MKTPRPYLSFSQMAMFEMSPTKYADHYIYGRKQRISRNMAYGSLLADGLEHEEATGDPVLDIMMARIPKFELMDKPLEAELKNGKEIIKILAKPDTAKADYTAFKEYKTSVRKWTQKMADDSGQISFYATAIYLKYGFIPEDIELVNVQVEYLPDGTIQPNGELIRFKTRRTMIDIIKMTARMKKAWSGIKQLCESELW